MRKPDKSRFFATAGLMLLLSVASPSTLLACISTAPGIEPYNVTGKAYDNSGELIYSEQLDYVHTESGGSLTAIYSLPDLSTIARKEVDFRCNLTTPAFELTDLNSQKKEGVEWHSQGESVISYQGQQKTLLDVPDGLTIFDAGFDNTIKLNWETLVAGESLKVNYLFARQNKFLALRLERAEPPSLSQVSVSPDDVFFKISADNIVFRLLSRPLYVGYDQNSRSLKYYIGPSNLPMMKHQKEIVIKYSNRDVQIAERQAG